MKYALIDLGSNTIRLAVYHVESAKPICLYTKKIFARAVSYKHHGVMSDDGIRIISDALKELILHASYIEPDALWCFATACLRGLENLSDVLQTIRTSCGLNVDVLSGDAEARLGVAGLKAVHNVSDSLCIDLGGGSCEISLLQGGEPVNWISLDIGSVSATKDYVSNIFPSEQETERLSLTLEEMLREISWLHGCGVPTAHGMGGSARALCRIHRALGHSDTPLDEYCVQTLDMKPLFERLCTMQIEGIRLADQYCPGRVFTLIPGIVILHQIMSHAGAQQLCLSSAGVREGYLVKKLSEQNGA